ncbi:MAG TPA: energy transducer TonB [Terracidiphilus sp.]|nr:energy transducer TonB [Terracidiphilus sp.]
MADEILNQPAALIGPDPCAVPSNEGHELDAFLGKAFEEKPIWQGLYESVRDIFFPVKLPPLELTCQPIPVPDRMKVKANPWAIGISTSINIAIALLAIFFIGRQVVKAVENKNLQATLIDPGIWQPKAPLAGSQNGGGGGGGNHSIVDPIKGHLPKIEEHPLAPPQIETVQNPIIPAPPAINVQKNITLPDNPTLPTIGVKSSANVVLASDGQGSGSGMGTGSGGGLGSGQGNGYGPGYGGGAGGGVYHVGGGVSAPVPLNSVEAEFSDEARRAKYQGVCLIQMIVDAHGMPQDPHVIRALGMGLDQKALEAVRKYRFKPALKDGKIPVPVMITVEVNFRLY